MSKIIKAVPTVRKNIQKALEDRKAKTPYGNARISTYMIRAHQWIEIKKKRRCQKNPKQPNMRKTKIFSFCPNSRKPITTKVTKINLSGQNEAIVIIPGPTKAIKELKSQKLIRMTKILKWKTKELLKQVGHRTTARAQSWNSWLKLYRINEFRKITVVLLAAPLTIVRTRSPPASR